MSGSNECAESAPTISGRLIPGQYLWALDGESISGDWRLHVSDNLPADVGSLNGWSLIAALEDADSDNDGCTDEQEQGPNQARGGRRDRLSFWDFFDVWTAAPPTRDRIVNIGDIGAVVARFGSFRRPEPSEREALAEALTTPAAMTGYHASADRGGPIPDQNLWNLRPSDGSIRLNDIGAVVVQFGHTCA